MGVPFSSNQLSMIYALALAGKFQDNCNCDGYATSIFTLSVSSASENGFHNCSHPHHHLTHNHHKHPDYHYLRKKQVASLGTANNAAVLWPQLIAQAVAGVPQKYFLWNLKQFENWENFRRHQVGNPLVYFLGTFFFRESTFAIKGNSDNWISSRYSQVIGFLSVHSLDIFQHHYYKDFWKSFSSIKTLFCWLAWNSFFFGIIIRFSDCAAKLSPQFLF